MKLTISLQVTLDGVAQANGGNNDEMDPGFTRGGWALPPGDDASLQYLLDSWRQPNAFLMGRKTFSLFESYWGARSDDGGFGEAISSKPRYVVSNTLTGSAWEGTTIIGRRRSAGARAQDAARRRAARGGQRRTRAVAAREPVGRRAQPHPVPHDHRRRGATVPVAGARHRARAARVTRGRQRDRGAHLPGGWAAAVRLRG